MKFVSNTKPGSFDTGDGIECITEGVKIARRVAKHPSVRNIATLAEWAEAAQNLLDASDPDRDDDEDDEG